MRQTKIRSPKYNPTKFKQELNSSPFKKIVLDHNEYKFIRGQRGTESNLKKVINNINIRNHHQVLNGPNTLPAIYQKKEVLINILKQNIVAAPIIIPDKYQYINSYISKIYQLQTMPNSVVVY